MRSLPSEASKKGGVKKLRPHRDKERCMLINCKSMREKARLAIKEKKRRSEKSGRTISNIGRKKSKMKQGEICNGRERRRIQSRCTKQINSLLATSECLTHWAKGKNWPSNGKEIR